MSEDLNRDPLVAKLVRLTPTAAGMDRETMLFTAGRASAPKAGRWKLATTMLALAQIATLALWLAASHSERTANTQPPTNAPALPALPSPAGESVPPGSYAELVRRSAAGELPAPAPFADPLPSTPALSIATSHRALDD